MVGDATPLIRLLLCVLWITSLLIFHAVANIYVGPFSTTQGWAIAPVTLTVSGSTFTPDCTKSNSFILTLTANSQTLANPTGCSAGQNITVYINNGVSAGYTGFSTGTYYKYGGGVKPSWSTTQAYKDTLSCGMDTSTSLQCAAIINGS
jgi:hypothetical protein